MTFPSHIKLRAVIGLGWTALLPAGCARSLPPEVTEFKPPAARKIVQDTTSAPAESQPTTPVVQAPPPPAPVVEERSPQASAPKATPKSAPVKAEVKAPSIVGIWQVAEMSHQGQAMPMPAGMTMRFTFVDDGTISASMSGGPAGADGQNRQGSYSVNESSITIDMDNEKKTGTLTFEGNDRAILDFDEVRMTLIRSAG